MKVTFLLQHAATTGTEFEIDSFPLIIGRCGLAGIRLNDCWVSRQHCELTFEGESLVVRDLESKHGTFVNDEPVTKATVRSGDRLGVGLSSFVVSYGETSAPNSFEAAYESVD